MRLMSFSMTEQQMRDGIKDVTRRMGWRHAKVGEQVQPVRQAMGLKRGQRVEFITPPIVLLDIRAEPLRRLLDDRAYGIVEVRREGFADHPDIKGSPERFVEFFIAGHRGASPDTVVTRLEFRRV